MIISNSKLFRQFARPVVRPSCEPQAGESSRKPGIMDSIVEYVMNRSKLEVSLIKITDANEE